MALTLVRHTRPAVEDGVCYGATDLGVADDFEGAARSVVASLTPCDVLVTSPLQRCRLLAERIGRAFELPPIVDERVREMDFGRWEGMLWSDVPRDEVEEWNRDFLGARPHGGESVAAMRARVEEALVEYRSSARSHIVVTHSGVIKCALATGDEARDFTTNVAFGEVIRLTKERNVP
ncbi:MAG: alpha-ribazole phosphatase family protein [Acidobacteriota bacterium]